MLLVDFGESAFKFALVKEHEKSLEVKTWGVEDIRSLEYATEHILAKTRGMHTDTEPILLSFPPSLWRSCILYESMDRNSASLRIDSAEKKTILEDLFARARLSLAKKVQDSSGILAKDIHMQKLHTFTWAIDGYEVQDILGFSGQHVEVHIMAVFVLAKHVPIVDTIIQRFSGAPCRIVHVVETLEGFSQRRLQQDALYLDMGDASCRIMVTHQRRVAFVDEIFRAGRDFTLYLQETLSLGENTAKDFKERYASGDFSFPLREGVKRGFQAIAQDIVRLVCESLRRVSAPLPPSVFLFGGTSKVPEIQEAFEGTLFAELPFYEKPHFSFLLPKDLWTLEFPGKTNPVLTPLFFLPYANKKSS
jgi:hypothetical protein